MFLVKFYAQMIVLPMISLCIRSHCIIAIEIWSMQRTLVGLQILQRSSNIHIIALRCIMIDKQSIAL